MRDKPPRYLQLQSSLKQWMKMPDKKSVKRGHAIFWKDRSARPKRVKIRSKSTSQDRDYLTKNSLGCSSKIWLPFSWLGGIVRRKVLEKKCRRDGKELKRIKRDGEISYALNVIDIPLHTHSLSPSLSLSFSLSLSLSLSHAKSKDTDSWQKKEEQHTQQESEGKGKRK